MTDQTDTTLDEFFGDESDVSDGIIQDAMAGQEADFSAFTELIYATLDELLPGANAGKRKAILQGTFGTDNLAVPFDKYSPEGCVAQLKTFVANVESKMGKADKRSGDILREDNAARETHEANKMATEVKQPDQPITPIPSLDNLPEAPFSATVKIYHKVHGVEVLVTVRSTTVQDGVRRLDTMLDKLLGERGAYSGQRADAPSRPAANASAPTAPAGQSAPVRSFDPDADSKPQSTEVLHEKVIEIEKVTAPDGKIQINLYAPDKPKFPVFYLKSDSDKREVYKHIDVDKMALATKYKFTATVDYVLSTKKNSKGNPYRNLRAIHPN